MRQELKSEFIDVVDKKMKNHSKYYKTLYVLQLNTFYQDHAGYITSWKVGYIKDGKYLEITGHSAQDFIDFLQKLKIDISLEKYICKKDGKSYSKDIIMFYVDEILKIKGFFKNFVTEKFSHYVQLLENFEFRSYELWNSDLTDLSEITVFMQELADKMFVPEKYFYLTPNQRTRKNLVKRRKLHNDNTALKLYPETMVDYILLRKALFGGICYCHRPSHLYDEPIIGIDLKSAYIYALLTMPHCLEKLDIDTKDWKKYLENPDYASRGTYDITYSTSSNLIHCYKDINGNNLLSGQHITVTIVLNNVDLNILLNINRFNIENVVCYGLDIYKTGYLPEYVRDLLVEEFIKKNRISSKNSPALYKAQKDIVNGIYGNTIKKVDNNSFKDAQKNATLSPHWGIWTTSYTKDILLGLATQVEGWVYSDTDSIYCYDTPKNRELISKYNEKIREGTKRLCDTFGYNYEELKDLGIFELDSEITKFKALKQKEYLYLKKDGSLSIKASGCNKEEMKNYDEDYLFNCEKLPVGTRIFKDITEEHTKCEKDGQIYESDGSYYEYSLNGEAAWIMLSVIAEFNNN